MLQFLGKDVPNEDFPRTNNPAGFEKRVEEWFAVNQAKALRNIGILGAAGVAITALVAWRVAPDAMQRMLMSVRNTASVGKS